MAVPDVRTTSMLFDRRALRSGFRYGAPHHLQPPHSLVSCARLRWPYATFGCFALHIRRYAPFAIGILFYMFAHANMYNKFPCATALCADASLTKTKRKLRSYFATPSPELCPNLCGTTFPMITVYGRKRGKAREERIIRRGFFYF